MDDARFQEAQRALAAKDYRGAAEGFLSAAGGPGAPGNGEAYHLAGNALMRLRKYQHAVTVYQHALRDTSYPKMSAVLVNLGTAQAALGCYDDAVLAFNTALADPTYSKRYKALQGRAGAMYAMGRYDEAARDYIGAAEPGNPDRGRAFNNLGLSLAAEGKPAEAVEAYKAALATDTYNGKGKAAANLGIAYAALGKHADAVKAFEQASAGYGYALSGVALSAYEASKRAVPAAPQRATVEAWDTGEQAAAAAPALVSAGVGGVAEERIEPVEPAAPIDQAAIEAALPVSEEEAEEFFTRTDKDMKALDRERRREERAEQRSAGNAWTRAAGAALGVVLVIGIVAGVFFAGYGYPTQRGTVGGMLDAYHSGKSVTDFWVAAAPTDGVNKEMATIPPNFAAYTVDTIDRSAFTSKVTITVKLDKGAPLRYRISLSREGLGWKVMGIDNDWGTGSGS